MIYKQLSNAIQPASYQQKIKLFLKFTLQSITLRSSIRLKNKIMPLDLGEQYSFVRTIRYTKKDNDNPFFIRYFGNSSNGQNNQDKKSIPKPNGVKQKEEIKASYQKVQRPQRENQHEKKHKQYRQTQMKQIQQLRQFAKVDIKKLRKQQRRQVQKMQRLGEKVVQKQSNKKIVQGPEKQQQFKKQQKKFVKPTQYRRNLGDQMKKPNLIRSQSISMLQKKEIKKQSSFFKQKKQIHISRKIYDEYLQIQEVQESRRKGQKKYYRGRVQFSERIKWFAKIKTFEVDGNIVAEGKYRNRCIHDDQVYFEIINQTPQKIYCKIVCIVPPEQKRQIVGRIDFLQAKRLYYITPNNKRFIAMNVRMNQIQRSWLKQINEKYFIVEFHSWGRESEYPECTVVSEYGRFGQIDIQSNALLKTHNVYEKEYTQVQIQTGLKKFLDQTDTNGQYQIQKQQIQKRLDLRNQSIFTIDPLTARDFDDALSIRKLVPEDFDRLKLNVNQLEQDQIYQIGVHIADASFFCQQGSIIDEEAKKRTTSVYLVHKVLPMLPRVLCETMCSLNPGLQRLTLSIWFYIDIEGNILPGVRFDRTVIKSKARFTYEQAQLIIQGKIKSQNDIPKGFGCIDSKDDRQIFHDIITMNTIALNLRKRRIQGGSLIFETPKKSFVLDEHQFPVGYEIKCRCQSNFLVEEYMLLANKKVGQILVENIRSQALLRRHQFPGQKKIATFEQFMKKIGHPIKIQKHTKIQEEINKILQNQTIKMAVKEIIKHQMIYLLQMAQYFVVGQTLEKDWLHYALNMPVYTHFTSPIRRYPDIIVHRQLISVIQAKKNNKDVIESNQQILKALVDKCNKNKISAKKVSLGCQKVFLCLYLKDKPAFTHAILVAVQDWGFKISVPKYDCRIVLKLTDLKNIKVLKFEKTQQNKKYMQVQVSEGDVSMKLVFKQLQQIQVRLGTTQIFPLDYQLNFVFPHPKKAGQKIIIK